MSKPNYLFATKSVDQLRAEAERPSGLKRTLSALDLTLLGIGAIIGTGIFVLTGRAAAVNAGPAVSLSFAIAAVASALAALCYAEMTSMIPVAGSAYTYAYATMGELVAWIIGWDLILEYMVSAATVSVGWSGYVSAFFTQLTGVVLPREWTQAPMVWDSVQQSWRATGCYVNLPAVLVVALMTLVVLRGVKESARVNAVIVFTKITAILLFVFFAARFIRPENWHPFIPENQGAFGHFGLSGIFQGATMVFFAYIGFDGVTTAAQEAKNPQRDLPIGILASLVVCSLLYIVVSVILTGVVNYQELSVPHPIAVGIQATGIRWLEPVVEIGAIAGLSSVILVSLVSQPRIFFAMARDGLFPQFAMRVHPRFSTPHYTTMMTGALVALGGGFLPIEILGELTSIGTLFAFVLVSLGVMILRLKRPDLPRGFRVPGGAYVVPLLSATASGVLMYTATTHTIMRLFGWLALGLLLYVFYGRRYSRLRQAARPECESAMRTAA